jgi:hypothetical protein
MSRDKDIVPYTYCFCRRCAARVELGRVAFGSSVTCPACGFEFTVERPARNHSGTGEGRGGGDQEDPDDGLAPEAWEASGGGLLARLFFAGTFTFPLRLENLSRTLTLCAGAIALVGAFRLGAWCFHADNEQLDRTTRVLLANGLLFSVVFGSLVLPAWLYAASCYGMTILRETACGVDRIRDWPHLLALEGLGEVLYVLNAALLSAAPGKIVDWLWTWLAIPMTLPILVSTKTGLPPTGLWVVGGMMLLFPILLLSMLAVDSAVHPLSTSAWKTLLCQWQAWLGFYVATFVAAIATVALAVALWPHAGWAAQVTVFGVLLAVGWMIYCRLLGRLASFCSHHPQGGASGSGPTKDG